MEETKQKSKSIHSGHRQRLKAKVQSKGIDSLADHEVLELLLSYCIPYKNTNDIAHNLINKFGNLKNVFGHIEDEYCQIDGIQHHTAFLLSYFPQIVHRYANTINNIKPKLNNVENSVDYFRKYHIIEPNESLIVCCLDTSNNLIGALETSSSSPVRVDIDMRYISTKILPLQPASVIIFHTHPNGSPEPTQSDVAATKRLITLCDMLGINFHDHIIVTENEYFSFCRSQLIAKFVAESVNVMNNFANQEVQLNLKQKISTYECEPGEAFDESKARPD